MCNELQNLGITNLVICPLRHDLKSKFSIEPINSIMHCFDRRWQLLTHYLAWKYVFSKKYFTIFYHFSYATRYYLYEPCFSYIYHDMRSHFDLGTKDSWNIWNLMIDINLGCIIDFYYFIFYIMYSAFGNIVVYNIFLFTILLNLTFNF